MVMLFEDFEKEVITEVQCRLENVKILSDVAVKNNGVKLHVLSLSAEGNNVGVYVYLDSLYARYVKCEMNLPEVADTIVEQYRNGINNFAFDISTISEYEKAKGLIRGRLINTDRNEEVLTTIPHRNFLDLTIIYSLDIKQSDGQGVGSVRISNDLMEKWGVDEETLYQQMMENMEASGEGKVSSMASMLEELCGMMLDSITPQFPMYVISNQQKANGAIEILNKNVMEKAAIMLGEDFWILPSSVHELILLPMKNKQEDKEYIRSMIRDINNTQVSNEEILSYNLYYYSQETGEIKIAA